MPAITALCIYPVKGLKGISLPSAHICETGDKLNTRIARKGRLVPSINLTMHIKPHQKSACKTREEMPRQCSSPQQVKRSTGEGASDLWDKKLLLVSAGFLWDRHWMLTRPDGRFLTQRQIPK